MNKKLILALAVFFLGFALVLGQTPAEAVVEENPDLGFISLWTTASGSPDETLDDEFGLGDTPHLFMELPESATDFTVSFWNGPNNSTSVMTFGGSGTKRWASPSNWSSVEEAGDWNIDASWYNSNTSHGGTGYTSFTVTPEPWAMALMAIGGLPIAANLYRKKKKA